MGTEIVRVGSISNTTAITIQTRDGAIAMSVDDVKRWIAPGAPDQECLKFLMICRAAEVDPFLKEAYLIPMGTKWEVVISKSGWLKRAELHPQYDGFESGIVVRKVLSKSKDDKGKDVVTYGDPEEHAGSIQPVGYVTIGGWCKVYRKDRTRPAVARISMLEFEKDTPTWRGMRGHMIEKVAIVEGLRRAGFLTSGCYDRDELSSAEDGEMGTVVSYPPAGPDALRTEEIVEAEFSTYATHQLDPGLARELQQAILDVGMSDFDRDQTLARRGVQSIVELSDKDARDILAKLYQILDRRNAGRIILPDPEPEEEAIKVGADGDAIDADSCAP